MRWPPSYDPGMNVSVDPKQVEQFARGLSELGTVRPFDFCADGGGGLFPLSGATGALESFFLNAAHQFGFWHRDQGRYGGPMISRVDGVERKGSDYLFYCFQRALEQDPAFFRPESLASKSDEQLDALFHDDTGRNPLPMWPDHVQLIKEYARWFLDHQTTPRALVDEANKADQPQARFLERAGRIPGYREDPLKKKLMLLVVILENRPEHFLRITDPESAVPIIDYHLQRSALRTGLIRVEDAALRTRLEAREEVSADEEADVRQATYDAIQALVEQSGLSVAAVDYFFFTNRTRCPEMTEPACSQCPVESICKQQTALFQPVFRTTAY